MADGIEIKYTVKPDMTSVRQGADEIAKAMGISGEQAAEAFAKGFRFDSNGRLRDELGRYVKGARKQLVEGYEDAGHKAGKGFGENFKKGFGTIGNVVAGLGIANLAGEVLSFVKGSAQASIELDKQVKNIGTLGVKNYEEFAAATIQLSKTVPDSAASLAGAVYETISAGISGTTEQIMSFVTVASKAGVAGMSDTTTAVSGLTSVLNAYKRPVSDAAAVSNELFAGVKLGKITFEQFTAGLGEAVPTAAALGVKFDEVSASIATITSQGVGAPQAFTKLNAVMLALQKPSADLSKVMSGVSVEIGGVTQKLTEKNIAAVIQKQGLTETLKQIGEAADKMGTSLTAAFEGDAGAAANLLAGKNAAFAADMLKKTREEIKAGAAEQAFNIANQSVDVQLKLLQNNLQAALQPIFANILPILSKIAQEIASIFQNPAIQKAFQSISIIMGDLLSTVLPPLTNTLMPVLSSLMNIIAPVAKGLGYVLSALTPIIEIIWKELSPVMDIIIEELMPVFVELLSLTANVIKDLLPVIKMLAQLFASSLRASMIILMPIIKELMVTVRQAVSAFSTLVDAGKAIVDVLGGSLITQSYEAMRTQMQLTTTQSIQLIQSLEKQVNAAYKLAELQKLVGSGEILKAFGIKMPTQKDISEKLKNQTAKTPAPAAGTGEKKSLEEQIKLNTELIAKFLQKKNLTYAEQIIMNNLVKKTKEMTIELEKQKKAQEQANKLVSVKVAITPVLNKAGINAINMLMDDAVKYVDEVGIKKSISAFRLGTDNLKSEYRDLSKVMKNASFDANKFFDMYESRMSLFFDAQTAINDLRNVTDALFAPVDNKEQQRQLKDTLSGYQKDKAALTKELFSKKISLEEFQQQSGDIAQKEADARVAAIESSNQKIVDSFRKMTDNSYQLLDKFFREDFAKLLEDTTNELTGFTQEGNISFQNFIDTGIKGLGLAFMALGSEFGAMFAEGGHDAGDYLKQFAVTVIDTVQILMNAWAAALLVKENTEKPFGLGFVSFALIIAAANGLLALAKGAIGADEGVIGINERYNKKASLRDTIPIWVRKGESILPPEFTDKHKDLLTHLYGGRSEESYFRDKYYMQPSNYAVNGYGELIKTNRALQRTIESGIQVKSTNINKIKIVDKTSSGIKVDYTR